MANQDTLSFVENLLGITSDIATNVQKTRDKRGNALKLRINGIIGVTGGGKPLHRRLTDNVRIEEIKNDLLNLQQEVDRSDIVTQQYLKSVVEDVDNSMGDNVRFREQKKLFTNPEGTGIEELLSKEVQKYMEMQSDYAGGVPDISINSSVKNIKDLLIRYGNLKEDFVSYFGDRVTKDEDLYNSIMSVETYSKFILQELEVPSSGKTPQITKAQHQMFREGLFEGNMVPLKEYLVKLESNQQMQSKTLLGEMDRLIMATQEFELEHASKFGDISSPESVEAALHRWSDDEYGKEFHELDDKEKGVALAGFNADKANDAQIIYDTKSKIRNLDLSYQDLSGGISYADKILNVPKVNNVDKLLPQSILSGIKSVVNAPSFASLNANSLDEIYRKLLLRKENMDAKGENYKENGEFMSMLYDFIALYEGLNDDIKESEEARRNNYKSIRSVDAYKDIDIEKISRLLK